MFKNKDKKEGDDASTQSNASRYNPPFSLFFSLRFLLLFTLTSMVDQLCTDFSHSFIEMVWIHIIDLGIVE